LTPKTPVEEIVALLTEAQFRRLEIPIAVAGVRFEFDAVLVGTGMMPDLIVVIDTATEKEDRVRTKIESLGRALDVVRSKRPLTTILAGPRPSTPILDAISKVCRVLPVGTLTGEDDEAALRNWLAILMPLTLPQTSEAIADPMQDLLRNVDSANPIIAQLLAAAPMGTEEVSKQFHRQVSQALDDADLEL
jgi:hypothetical protein